MKEDRIRGTGTPSRFKRAFVLLLMFSVASSTLFTLIPTLQATVSWGGWWVETLPGVWKQVTVSYDDDVVQARWWVNNEPAGSYRVRVMRDIALLPDQVVTTKYIDYDGGYHEYSLPFRPPYLTGEAGTNGYYMDLYGFFGGTWVELWTMPNSYPPRLKVLARYVLTIDVYGSGTTNPAPGSYRYGEGTGVSVDAIPAEGWTLYSWLLDGVDVGSSDPYTVTMDSNHYLTAVFVKPLTWDKKIDPAHTGSGIIPCTPAGIAVDSNNYPRIIYTQNWRFEPPYWYQLVYARYNGISWSDAFPHVASDAVDESATIALDSQDNPHIACRTQEHPEVQPEEIVYAYWDGTRWVTETVYSVWYPADLYGGISFALDPDDKPYIAFFSLDDGLMLATKDLSGTWIFEIVDPEVDWTAGPSLALHNYQPCISYFAGIYGQDMCDLIYAWRGLTTWHNETVDSATVVGMTSLALESDGSPHIGYEKGGAVRYAWRDGSTWNNEIVDSGRQPSLALDSLDRPHIGYSGYPAKRDLRYAWRVSTGNGNVWVKQIVDSEQWVGNNPSLALDSFGNPHISYQYEDPATYYWYLKYATTSPPNQPPVADANGPYTGTEDVSVSFDGSGSYDPDGIIVSYKWYFGDGNSGTGINPTHTYTQAGTYTVTLTVTDDRGAKDTHTTTATIIGPTADFSGTPTSGPEPLTVSFTDLSTSYEGITGWDWDFDNNGVIDSTSQNPTHVYDLEGVYTVTLKVYEADGDNDVETKIDYIVVSDAVPVADFSGTPTSGSEPLTVDFTDLSTSYDGITSWEWDFDNNGVVDSTVQNPTHVYALEGVYTVTLKVYEADGDNDVRTKIAYIVVSDAVPVPDFSGTPRTGNPPLTVSFTDLSTSYDGKVIWVWNFGDGKFSTEQNPTHTYTGIDTYTVSLTVYDSEGDSATETKVNYIIVGFINVVFEEAHVPYYSIGTNFAYHTPGGYAEFADYLTANGYFVSTIDWGTTIDSTALAPVDVLVIVAPQGYYSTSEIDAIEAWVKDGGTLLLITEQFFYGDAANAIATRFGITQPFDLIIDFDDNVVGDYRWPYYDGANLLAHPVTDGVTRVEMYWSDGITTAPVDAIPLIVTDSDGSAYWYYSGQPALGVSLMSAIDCGGTAGSGRLIFITDSSLWDSVYDLDGDGDVNFYDSDNEILALNAIDWLSAVRHDVAVTDVAPSKSTVGEGYSIAINVTVENQGTHTETFDVTVYANTTSIAFQTVTLTRGSSTTITFTWNTSGFAYGKYTIRAYATPVLGETDTTDNEYVDGWVMVTIIGDVNGDGVVDASDLLDLNQAYGSTPDSPNWNPNCDFNGDDKVDALDLFDLSKNYGKTDPYTEGKLIKAYNAWAFIFALSAAVIVARKFRKNNERSQVNYPET